MNHLCDLWSMVCRQVIHDNDVALTQDGNQYLPDVLQKLFFRCTVRIIRLRKTLFVQMAAGTVVALGLFSGEWPTIRFPPNVRPYRLTIPRFQD